jgi:flagellar biogenesis protein FliO
MGRELRWAGEGAAAGRLGGWTDWLRARLSSQARPRRRLELIERIALGPRQTLALVEVEGRRFLVASAAEGAPAVYPLEREGAC